MVSQTDSIIIEQIKDGNHDAFITIYEKYVTPIYNFISYKVYDQIVAEDLSSETFVKAYDHIGNFDTSKGTIKSWLYRIAYNTVLDYRKTNKDLLNLDETYMKPTESKSLDGIDAKYKMKEVVAYLDTLGETTKDIVLLKVWENYSYEEIAEIVGKTPVSCRKTYSRAIKKLIDTFGSARVILFLLSSQGV